MTPSEIYSVICGYSSDGTCVICDLHSACMPAKGKKYMCSVAGSKYPVLNFDAIKEEVDKEVGIESRKSVDALALSPSCNNLCFVELKSWNLLIKDKGTEEKIMKKADKYSSDLPAKLLDSLTICREIVEDHDALHSSNIMFILVSDISVDDDGLDAINSDLSALAGTTSNLNVLCNRLSLDIMQGIADVNTYYWECRNFDNEIARF